MAVPINLKDIQSGFLTAASFNANNELVEQAFVKTLNRTSNDVDNAMEVDLDMGLNRIFNLADAVLGHEAVNKDQLFDIVARLGTDFAATIEEQFVATQGQTAFTLNKITYNPGLNNIVVYINGVRQNKQDYVEASPTSVVLTTPIREGDLVTFVSNERQAEVNLNDIEEYVDSLADNLIEPKIEQQVASEGQTSFQLQDITYVPAANKLTVYINGVRQYPTAFTEASQTEVVFVSPLSAGDQVLFVTNEYTDASTISAKDWATVSEQNASASILNAGIAEGHADDAEGFATSASNSADTAQAAAGYKLGVNTQSGTSYTLVASDAGDLVRMTNAGANTVTVPTNASVPFEIGTIVNIRQSGLGTTTISAESGVTINAPLDEFTTDGEEFGVAIVKVGTDEWDLVKSYAGVRSAEFDASITAVLGTSGYQKLPSGLILQWGRADDVPISQPDKTAVIYPTPFPISAINVSLTVSYGTAVPGNLQVYATDITNSGFNIFADESGDPATADVYWFAIGV